MAKVGGILVLLALTTVGTVGAQEVQGHTVTDQELRSAVRADVEAERADRALVDRVLARGEVRSVAEKAGVDVERARRAVPLLEGGELSRVASLAGDLEEQLAGGQSTITITTTTLIIALLVLILIIVA
ncbi:MAG: hypothetical protein R3234_13740 [Thermoanaerobaculia bacterium]|nr:hypothetical protein [Thermoanaerobaculia bacterium]